MLEEIGYQNLKDILEVNDRNSIWLPASVTAEPHVKLHQWQVYKVDDGKTMTIHFNGRVGLEGRVSSPIVKFDLSTMRGVSRSGRIYELTGFSGYTDNSKYVWVRWLGLFNVIPEVTNITSEYESSK